MVMHDFSFGNHIIFVEHLDIIEFILILNCLYTLINIFNINIYNHLTYLQQPLCHKKKLKLNALKGYSNCFYIWGIP